MANFTTLADVCESVRYGYTASASLDACGPRFLRITDIVPDSIQWNLVPYCEIDDSNKERFTLDVGDIVIARTGATVGYAKLIREPVDAVFASYLVRFRVDSTKADPGFIGRLVESQVYKSFVQSRIGGAAQPNASAPVLGSFEFRLPPLFSQERIADILSGYDDLIENNRRRMALLEDSARLLYNEWFVRLRFPGFEHTHIIDGLPEGWKRTTISGLGKVITGKTPSTKDSDNFGTFVPFIKTPDMHVSSIVMFTEEYLSEKGANSQKNKTLPPNSILVACIGAKLGVVSLNGLESQTNQQINAVVPANECLTYYAYFTLKDFREKLLAIGGGATMPNVNKTKFESMSIAIPAQYLLDSFHETVKHNFEQIKTLILMNKKLETARDLLLPRLISGEIVV